jgi:predicted amidophosphoribosyltransferase
MEPGTAGVLVHALKYEGWTAVATTMARAMARLEWPEDVVAERTALVPMPLSPARERERGYNQAERLASALSAACGRGPCVGCGTPTRRSG